MVAFFTLPSEDSVKHLKLLLDYYVHNLAICKFYTNIEKCKLFFYLQFALSIGVVEYSDFIFAEG